MKIIKEFFRIILKFISLLLGLFLWAIVMLLPYCLSNEIVEYIEERN